MSSSPSPSIRGAVSLPCVHPGGDVVPVGAQRLRCQQQTLLGGGAHENQRDLFGQKSGLGFQVGLHDLQLPAAALQIVDVLQIAVEVAYLRK